MAKKILDATCGSRMMWFDRNNPNTLYMDKRKETIMANDKSSKGGQRVIEVNPDILADFTEMPFADNTFYLVVFDPPHLNKLGKNSWLAKKYGQLLPTWETDIKGGFDECMRVLKPNGTLIFKWNENQIKVNKIIELIGVKPLFGHPSGKHGQTIWMTFMKTSDTKTPYLD
jgi:ubiquinone/menaquinone biosynthesis C-methylase UbiE